MRRYKSESIGKIIGDMGSDGDLGVLRSVKRQQELIELWQTLPDAMIRRLDLEATVLDKDRAIVIKCPTPLALNHMRGMRRKIENHLLPFMQKWDLTELRFQLNDR